MEGRYHSPLTISAATFLPAVAGLVVVHRAVLAALLAALRRGLCCKRARANHRRQNRKQNFRVRLHTPNLPREMNQKQAENQNIWNDEKRNKESFPS